MRTLNRQLKAIVSGVVGLCVLHNLFLTRVLIYIQQPYDGVLIGDHQGGKSLPVYWINKKNHSDDDDGDKKNGRRSSRMEQLLAQLEKSTYKGITSVRVPAITIGQVKTLLDTNRLVFHKDVTLVDEQTTTNAIIERATGKKENNPYSYQDAACLVSHLTAILQAYTAGHETVLVVVEEDAVFQEDFVLHWQAYANRAPRDWTVLQWSTSNPAIVRQGRNLVDPWLSWLPDHSSTNAYMLNRKGMRQILQRVHHSMDSKNGGSTTSSWHVDEPGIVRADELIYYYAKKSYTCTYPWIGDNKDYLSSTRRSSSSSNKPSTLRPERILVIANLRMTNEDSVHAEIQRLLEDVDALSVWHANCTWVVNAVLTNQNLEPVFLNVKNTSHNNIDFRVQISNKRFNKYGIFQSLISEMASYDYVLQKDSDQRLTGFPWNSFMENKGDALVSGPLRQVVEDSLRRNVNADKSKRQFFQVFDGHAWKMDKSLIPLFATAGPIQVPYIEQYFTLLQGDFAQWFFQKILTQEFLSQITDWGPDFMWCAAAREFNSHQTSCHLVPVVSLHEDTKSIGLDEEYVSTGFDSIARMRRSNPVFHRWISKMDSFYMLFGGNVDLGTVRDRCRQVSLVKTGGIRKLFNLQECFRNVEMGLGEGVRFKLLAQQQKDSFNLLPLAFQKARR
jgi:hypothetical protein